MSMNHVITGLARDHQRQMLAEASHEQRHRAPQTPRTVTRIIRDLVLVLRLGPAPPGRRLPARERSGQPEPRQHAVVEAGHGADLVAGQGEHAEAGRVADSGQGAQVGPERGLAVGARRDEV
jgi:hypothetical protein